MSDWCLSSTRTSKHRSYTRASDDRKEVSASMSSNNLNIAHAQASVLKFSNTSFNRTIIKSVHIKYFSDRLYNIHPGPYTLDPFTVYKIINFLNF